MFTRKQTTRRRSTCGSLFLALATLLFIHPDLRGQSAPFTGTLITDHKVHYENPKPYELMHIAFALTDQNATYKGDRLYPELIDTSTAYYRLVMDHFSRFNTHPLIRALEKGLRKNANRYLFNLQKAYATDYADGRFRKKKMFSLGQRLPVNAMSVKRKKMRSFAKASGFAAFYEAHRPEYRFMLSAVQEKADVRQQQTWLEAQFPGRYQGYHIVVSRLMGGTHFTKRVEQKGNSLAYMWVPGYLPSARHTEDVNAARYTGIVMTEIDHNYVNPVSDGYEKTLNEIMGEPHRAQWASGPVAKYYPSGYKVFNEYMTHAVYLLYLHDHYPAPVLAVQEEQKIRQMTGQRGFTRFDAFYAELKKRYQQKPPGQTISSLYPGIIEWCRTLTKIP